MKSLYQKIRIIKTCADDYNSKEVDELEQRIKDYWPESWGDNLHVWIYGDFDPPSKDIFLPALEITINHEAKDKTKRMIARSAQCEIEASIKIKNKSVDDIIHAVNRLNLFLGTWTLIEGGNGACSWWSPIAQDRRVAQLMQLGDYDINPVIDRILLLPKPIRQKINAALYWIREPRNQLSDSYRSDLLRKYSAYWNAFECLVDAVNKRTPEKRLSPSAKKAQIKGLIDGIIIKAKNGELTPEDISDCHFKMNPGFRSDASRALKVCFPKDADRFIYDCFEIREERNHPKRLYSIRNAIDHGFIDAENPEELERIKSRFTLLHIIVWRMFDYLIQIPHPNRLKPQKIVVIARGPGEGHSQRQKKI